jgi:hypothetical protein
VAADVAEATAVEAMVARTEAELGPRAIDGKVGWQPGMTQKFTRA